MRKGFDTAEIRPLIRQGWEAVAAEYARDRVGIFHRSAARLLDLLQLAPGTRLLDVATGTGAVALQACRWVGEEGHVTGCDLATGMVSLARREAEARGLAGISFCEMDAESLDGEDASFDAVTCAFSLFQFPDMDRALTEMWRVLRPGGRLGLSNWGAGYFSPVASLQRNLFREFGIKPLLSNPIATQPDALRTMLDRASFASVKLLEETEEVWFRSPQEIWAFNLDMGPFPVMLQRQLSSEQRQELETRFMTMLQDHVTERGIRCTFNLLYALAEKGGSD